MESRNKRANEMAMKEMDRHASGDPAGKPTSDNRSETMHAHTKPAGDMRKIEMKEESHRRISRADQMRSGNKNR